METELDVTGEIVERQELLNGTESVTLEGIADGGWTVVSTISWNLGLVDFEGEGDLTLTRTDGAELYATATRVRVAAAGDEQRAFDAAFEVDGGTGTFEGAHGEVEARGYLGEDDFSGRFTVRLRERH